MKPCVLKLFLALVICLVGIAVSAKVFNGVYFSTNFGVSSTANFDYLGSSTDQGSVCDPVINPNAESRQIAGCPTEGTGWLTSFDNGMGIANTVIVGRHFGGTRMWKNWSVEVELSYGESALDQRQSIRSRSGVARDKLSNEIYRAEEHIGKITSQSSFANLRYNARSEHKTRLYFGAGLGLVKTSIYGGRIWVRNNDWTQISTGSNLPNSEEVRRNLANTTSAVHETLDDSSPTVQFFAGVDFQVNETVLFGVRGRFFQLDSFDATGSLDVLRSHEVPANYSSKREIDSLRFLGIGLTLTVQL